tara:strand:- start:269 stop:2350 length:2082 start_codon:yes stop_codon:yes gene_type:complete
MSIKKNCIILALLFLNIHQASLIAQNILQCATDENLANKIVRNPELIEKLMETENLTQDFIFNTSNFNTDQIHRIPVVVHIIYSNQIDNISDAQVFDAIQILNEDTRRTNSDASNLRSIFNSVAADIEVEFVLAKKDPNGNCTNGITRTQSNLSLNANDNVKSLINWDNKKYMNIWVVRSINLPGSSLGPGSIIRGYSAFPYNNIPATDDGIVIRHANFGSIGTSQGSRYRTLTHEVGHFLNLKHTFQNGCSGGDNCPDTPPVANSNAGCNVNQNSCTFENPDLPDMIENYMDYTDDNCRNTFTINQKQRAKAVLNISYLRGNLTTASNHNITGIDPSGSLNCFPVADFSVGKKLICSGEQIQITENCSYEITPSFHYTISDQNNANQQHIVNGSPLITFNNPGVYDVKLEIQNPQGQSMKQYPKLITVRPHGGVSYSPFFSATMEKTLPNDIWARTDNGDNIIWKRTPQASQQGLYSYFLENFNIPAGVDGDALIAGPIQLNNPNTLQLKFNHAFARKQSNNSDKLKIYTSTDCGENWILRKVLPTFQLGISNLYPSNIYIPSSNEWMETTINLNSLISKNSLMIKFEMFSGGGNNVYIDNLNLSYSINKDELSPKQVIQVYPSPSNNNAIIKSNSSGKILILNAIGEIIYSYDSKTEPIIIGELSSGLHYVIFTDNSGKKQRIKWININID